MFGFFKEYKKAQMAQRELIAAFKVRGENFLDMRSELHDALMKEAIVNGVEAAIKTYIRMQINTDSPSNRRRKKSKEAIVNRRH